MLRRKFLSFLMTGVMVVSVLSGMTLTKEVNADLVKDGDYYLISSIDDFVSYIYIEYTSGTKAKLTTDLVFEDNYVNTGITSSELSYCQRTGMTLDGDGHTITNFNISNGTSSRKSIFEILQGGKVLNLTMDMGDVNLEKKSDFGFVANMAQSCTFENCIVKGKVTGCTDSIDNLGAICGLGQGVTFDRCVSYLEITKECATNTGGICGKGNTTSFSDCVNYGLVKGKESTGGICGLMDDRGGFTGCVNYGDVSTNSKANAGVGGVLGEIQKLGNGSEDSPVSYSIFIVDCLNYGDITNASNNAGGLVGDSSNVAAGRVSADNCANNGIVTAIDNVGGIIGGVPKTSDVVSLTDCYNAGEVIATSSTALNFGGILGTSDKSFEESFSGCEIKHTHTLKEISRVDATKEKEGSITYKCTVCNSDVFEIIPKIGSENLGDKPSAEAGEVEKTPARGKVLSAKNLKKKSVTVKIKKTANAEKYQIQISNTNKFKKKVKGKKKYLKSNTTTKAKVTFKKLKKGKTYFVRVRGINGTKKGKWSKVKKVKVRK